MEACNGAIVIQLVLVCQKLDNWRITNEAWGKHPVTEVSSSTLPPWNLPTTMTRSKNKLADNTYVLFMQEWHVWWLQSIQTTLDNYLGHFTSHSGHPKWSKVSLKLPCRCLVGPTSCPVTVLEKSGQKPSTSRPDIMPRHCLCEEWLNSIHRALPIYELSVGWHELFDPGLLILGAVSCATFWGCAPCDSNCLALGSCCPNSHSLLTTARLDPVGSRLEAPFLGPGRSIV